MCNINKEDPPTPPLVLCTHVGLALAATRNVSHKTTSVPLVPAPEQWVDPAKPPSADLDDDDPVAVTVDKATTAARIVAMQSDKNQ